MGVTVVTEPTVEPVSLPEALEQLRFPHAHENQYISALITASRKYVEHATGKALITQTLRETRDRFPGWRDNYIIRLPRPPLQTVTNIQYTDDDAVTQTVDAATYIVDATSIPGRIALKDGETWPTDVSPDIASVKINYVAGYGLAASVPKHIKQAMLLLIGHWFVNREAVGTATKEIEFSLRALLGMEWSGSMVGTFG